MPVHKVALVLAICCIRLPGQTTEADCTERLSVSGMASDFQVWLESIQRSRCGGRPDAILPGAVSVRTLSHKPSPKARQEFDRGMRERRKGRAMEAAEHFEAAARLDSDFVDAFAYAGLEHVEAHQPAQALVDYQKAVQLEPGNAALLSNLAVVLMALNRPADAESAGRRGVQLAPASQEAHYMLGLALFIQNQTTSETVAHLTIAAEKYPRAREILARIQPRIQLSPE